MNTLLTASAEAFIIRERSKRGDGTTVWADRYFYTEIGDALRGYVRRTLRRPEEAKKLDGNIHALINKIADLEESVKNVGEHLNAHWIERLNDPIEAHLLARGE
jgi:hypothetical protein